MCRTAPFRTPSILGNPFDLTLIQRPRAGRYPLLQSSIPTAPSGILLSVQIAECISFRLWFHVSRMSIINGSSAFSDPRVLPSFLCNLQTYNYALFLIIFFVFAIYSVFVSQLRSIPGPLISHVTPLYRVWILWSGDCASKFQALHQRYGPVVRTGPDCVVISENAAVAKIYGRGWRFPKSQFYRLFALTQHSVMRDTVFSTRSRNEHEVLASHVAGRFSSPLNLAASESMIDKCVALFVAKMRDAGGQTIDLGTWLKYWAFDTNSGFCFGSPVGLIAAGEDLNGMIAHTETGFRIGALVGQVPRCNRFFLGNKAVMRLLKRVGVEDLTTFLVKVLADNATLVSDG
ncbi:cytochrome P450 [Viridothelium virens]|uniref:Cytochrome P450 n=1 Tax=Viridothelium virens TaxID=1048519 RepID=A0A6A6HAD3_VIRVR|nr:cytochrome P450 [Viridothelium virens]